MVSILLVCVLCVVVQVVVVVSYCFVQVLVALMVDERGDLFKPPPRLLPIPAVISLIQILEPPDTLCVVGLLVFLVVLMQVGDQGDHLEVGRPNNTGKYSFGNGTATSMGRTTPIYSSPSLFLFILWH